MNLLSKKDLEHSLGLRFRDKNLLITFHPVTLEKYNASDQIDEILDALTSLKDTTLIFTMPNADTSHRVIYKKIKAFVVEHKSAYLFKSLGQLRYLSCMALVDAVLGNSSSGLLEAPALNTATINIGDRQRGRLQSSGIINCRPIKKDIENAINYLYTSDFRSRLEKADNPYGIGGGSKKILNILKKTNLKNILKKRFYDLD